MTATRFKPTTTWFVNEYSTKSIYEPSGCGFESHCSSNRACFVQGVPWHIGSYRVYILSKTRSWLDKNLQNIKKIFFKYICIINWASKYLLVEHVGYITSQGLLSSYENSSNKELHALTIKKPIKWFVLQINWQVFFRLINL